jgi:hypothetical protein
MPEGDGDADRIDGMRVAKDQRSLAGSGALGEYHQGFHAVGRAVSKLVAPIVVKRGGGVLVRLKAEWAAIVGADWARLTWPLAFGRDGVLKLRTVPTAALELQHQAPLFIDRINLHLGRAAVGRLVLAQGSLPPEPEPSSPQPGSLGDSLPRAGDPPLSGIADPGLRAALGRLAGTVNAAGS